MHAPSNSLLMLDPPHTRYGRRLALFTGALLLPVQQQPLLDGSIGSCLQNGGAHESTSGGSVVGPAAAAAAAAAGGGRIPMALRHSYCRRSIDALFAAGAMAEEKDDEGAERSQQPSSTRHLQHDPLHHRHGKLDDGGPQPAQDSGRVAELTSRKRWQRLRPMAVARALGRVLRGNRRSGLNSGATPQHKNITSRAADGGGGRLLRRWRARQRQGRARRHPDPADGHLAAATDEVEKQNTAEAGGGAGKHRTSIRESGGEINENVDPAAASTAAAVAAVAVAGDGDSGIRSANSSVVVNEGICVGVDGSGAALRPGKYDGEDVSPEAWTKVGELRARAERSDPNAGEEEKGLHTWLATSGGEGRAGLTDMDLLRFVMFRHGDVDAAWRQLKRAAAWRQERRVEAVLSEDQWSRHKELQAEIFWVGRQGEADGRPTMVLRSIAHNPGAIDSEEFQRYFLFLLEQGRQLWGLGAVQQLNIIVDRVGAGIKNQDPLLLQSMLPVFRDAYPDIVFRCYVAPTSWIFRFVWIIAARLVDNRQRKRVLLLSSNWQDRLLEDFDASVLPPHLGGTMVNYPPPQPPEM
ncbi:unnamed protein product [Ectocarpus sp. 12 AP-2014]